MIRKLNGPTRDYPMASKVNELVTNVNNLSEVMNKHLANSLDRRCRDGDKLLPLPVSPEERLENLIRQKIVEFDWSVTEGDKALDTMLRSFARELLEDK